MINLIHDDQLQVNSFEEIFELSLLCEYTIHHDHHHANHQNNHHTMIKPDQNPINQQLMMNNTNHWNDSYDHHDGLMSSSIHDYYACNSSMLSFGNPSNDNENVRFGAQLPTNDQA